MPECAIAHIQGPRISIFFRGEPPNSRFLGRGKGRGGNGGTWEQEMGREGVGGRGRKEVAREGRERKDGAPPNTYLPLHHCIYSM